MCSWEKGLIHETHGKNGYKSFLSSALVFHTNAERDNELTQGLNSFSPSSRECQRQAWAGRGVTLGDEPVLTQGPQKSRGRGRP